MSKITPIFKMAMTMALDLEIDYIKNNPDIPKDKLDISTFDPLHQETCFLGQLELQHSDYRETIGKVPESFTGRYFESGRMTPLEVWSANEWIKGNREAVVQVLNYLKGEGPKPEVVYN